MPRRPSLLDLAVGGAVGLLGVVEAIWWTQSAFDPVAVQVVYAILIGAAVTVRAVAAPLAAGLAAAGMVLVVLLAEPLALLVAGFAIVLLLPYSCTVHLRGSQRWLALGLVALTVAAGDAAAIDPMPLDAVIDQVFVALSAGAGLVVASRQTRVEYVAATAEARTSDALAAERTRIARELHDIVGHALTVVVVQADSARHTLPPASEEAAKALNTIEQAGREALDEMRRLVGLLRHDLGGRQLAPQPGVADLPALAAGLKDAGLTVALEVTGEAAPLSDGQSLTVYRIVQEALTNTVRHAGSARASVRLTWGPRNLDVEVVDEGGGSHSLGQGRGLLGIEERARLYGGSASFGAHGAGWRVHARLPLHPTRETA